MVYELCNIFCRVGKIFPPPTGIGLNDNTIHVIRGAIYETFLVKYVKSRWSNFFLKAFHGERAKINFFFKISHFWRFGRQKFKMAEIWAKNTAFLRIFGVM